MNDPTCHISEETVHRYADGELSAAERLTFETHLPECKLCQSRLAELEALTAELAAIEAIEPPLTLTNRVMAELPAQPVSSRLSPLGWLLLAGQLATGLLLMLIGWPMLVAAVAERMPSQIVPPLFEINLAFNLWLAELAAIQVEWPALPSDYSLALAPVGLSLPVTLTLIVGLGLAWLIGNGLLLRQPPNYTNGDAS